MEQNLPRPSVPDAVLAISDFFKEKGSLLAPATEQIIEASPAQLSQGYYRLAKIYYDKSDLSQAEEYFVRSKELAVSSNPDIFFVFKILGFLVRIASEKLDASKAEVYISESEKLVQGFPSSSLVLRAEHFYNKGVVQNYRGKFTTARDSFYMAYKKSQEENEPEIVAKSLFLLASSYFHTKEYEKALGHLEQLAALLEILKKSYLAGTMNFLCGNVYSEMGEFHKALKAYKLANTALLTKNCWNLFAYVKLSEGIVYKKLGEFNKALLYFDLGLNSVNQNVFKRLNGLLRGEILDVNDSNVDIYLDRTNRMVYEKNLGAIDFKHRFILLEILFLLAQNPGLYYDKEELAKSIWKDEYNPLIHDKLIYTSVSRLRKLIEPEGERGKYIIRGKDGYAFSNKVKARFHKENEFELNTTIGNIELSSPV